MYVKVVSILNLKTNYERKFLYIADILYLCKQEIIRFRERRMGHFAVER